MPARILQIDVTEPKKTRQNIKTENKRRKNILSVAGMRRLFFHHHFVFVVRMRVSVRIGMCERQT